jgi:SAM-dependent MidA family methyltransferase
VDHSPLKTFLVDTIERSGPITFERYMGLCLYHPEYGYYTQGRRRTGAAGDYFTSPDMHPIFARLVARQAVEMWEMLGRPSPFCWVEMGAGSGLFAQDFLSWVTSARPDFADALEYVTVEPSPRQCEFLKERLAETGLARAVRLLGNLEQLTPIIGCFFSNELVDAFPVAIVTRAGGHLREIYVTAEGEELREKTGRISNPAVAAAAARYAHRLEEGCRAEVNLAAADWMRSVAGKLDHGFVITIDYGDLAPHLHTEDRPQGTLLAYHRHMPLDNALSAPGEVDLTAHVNFSALIDAGRDAGLDLTGFTSQERFLLALGEANQFADLYEPGATEIENLQARLKLKRLIHPEGMGNVFKVLVQHRGIDSPTLTGLKYGKLGD